MEERVRLLLGVSQAEVLLRAVRQRSLIQAVDVVDVVLLVALADQICDLLRERRRFYRLVGQDRVLLVLGCCSSNVDVLWSAEYWRLRCR